MKHTNAPKNFALQLGALACLYIALGSLVTLLFSLINIHFPDAIDSYWEIESATESARFAIAILFVVFPAYLILSRFVTKSRRSDKPESYLTITKWLLYLSLLIAGGVLLGDLIAVIYTFLNGEITARFILKVLTILIWFGLAFLYYLKDVQGYWLIHERESKLYAVTITVAVIVIVLFGLTKIETPTEVREARLDERQIQDLQHMQYQIEAYYRLEEVLPENLTAAYDDVNLPEPPEDRPAYGYKIVDVETYELCATFATDQEKSERYPTLALNGKNQYSWNYRAGEYCFTRKITTDNLE